MAPSRPPRTSSRSSRRRMVTEWYSLNPVTAVLKVLRCSRTCARRPSGAWGSTLIRRALMPGDREASPGRGAATVPVSRKAVGPRAELAVDPLEDPRMEVQGLHDGEPHAADVLEEGLSRGLAAGGILAKVAQDALETLVGLPLFPGELPALLVGAAAVGPHLHAHVAHLHAHVAHLHAHVAQLFQDQPDTGLDIAIA